MKHIPLKFICSFFFSAVLIFSSCKQESATSSPDLTQIRAEIQAMENTYAAAQNSGDVAAIMPYYANDAVSMTDKAPSASGSAAIMERLKKDLGQNKNTYQFDVVDVFAGDNLVVETGKTTVKDSTGTVVSTGKYLSVFEKRDSTYVCIRDIYNEDAAPASK